MLQFLIARFIHTTEHNRFGSLDFWLRRQRLLNLAAMLAAKRPVLHVAVSWRIVFDETHH